MSRVRSQQQVAHSGSCVCVCLAEAGTLRNAVQNPSGPLTHKPSILPTHDA
jgi:hypothetical protein